MDIHLLKDPVYSSNVYLIASRRPILIDTGGGDGGFTEEVLAAVRTELGGRPLAAVVLTHGHPDHVGGAKALKEALGVPVLIHPGDAEAVAVSVPGAQPLGDAVDVGEAVFRVIHTPGHTPGGVCLYEPDEGLLFSGDTVFPGGRTGRWDLAGSDHAALWASLKRLNALKPEVRRLYPGHYEPLMEGVAAHLAASLETLEYVGDPFDEAKYDARIASLDL